MAPTRVWLLAAALALACVLLARSADAAEGGGTPAPASGGGSVFGCNPVTDKTCRPEGLAGELLPGGGVDIDGDGDEDELPAFNPHLTILGHGH